MSVFSMNCAPEAARYGQDFFRNHQPMGTHDWKAAGSEVRPLTGLGSTWTSRQTLEDLDLLGRGEEAFGEALRALREELAPRSWMERLLVDQIVVSAGRLRAAATAESDGHRPESWCAVAEVAGRSMADALTQLERLRRHQLWVSSRQVARSGHLHGLEELAEPWPGDDDLRQHSAAHQTPIWEEEVEEEEGTVPSYDWTARLALEESVSASSPVVRGTRLTAGYIVSLVIDGRTWSQILHAHPELEEADIRACLDYTLDQEGAVRLGGESV